MNWLLKTTCVLFLISIVLQAHGQKLLLEEPIDLKAGQGNAHVAFPIENTSTNQTAIFFDGNKTLQVLQLNDSLQKIAKHSFKSPGRYLEIIGYSIHDNQYHLFYKRDKLQEFVIKSINLSTSTEANSEFVLDVNELFLEAISKNDKLYILTIGKKTSKLNVRVFEGGKEISKGTIDFSSHYPEKGKSSFYHFILANNGSMFKQPRLRYVDTSISNSFEVTSELAKVYLEGNELIITLDGFAEYTEFYKVNLTNYTYEKATPFQVYSECDKSQYKVQSNTYYLNGKLFQIRSCKTNVDFQIFDVDKRESLYKLSGDLTNGLPFKYPKLAEKGSLKKDAKRSQKSISMALSSLTQGNLGISVVNEDSSYLITIGKYYLDSGNPGIPIMLPGASIPIPGGSLTVAPTFSGISRGFVSRKTVSHDVLGLSLERASLAVLDNLPDEKALDRIETYDRRLGTKISAQTIIEKNGDYIFGYYDRDRESYMLVKFYHKY